MPKTKKKFIDKKNAVTFHLVHRSQRDPLQANEDVSQRILLPVNPTNDKGDREKRKEKEHDFGVFFDDDYDYLQHLKDANEINEVGVSDEPVERFRLQAKKSHQVKKPSIQLSSTLFASEVETEVGLLNKAAPRSGPRLDWDPDVVAALDDDFDYDDPENILDDDFIMAANAGELATVEPGTVEDYRKSAASFHSAGREEGKTNDDDDDDESDEDSDDADEYPSDEADEYLSDEADEYLSDEAGSDLGNLNDDGFSFTEEETKSRFTQYSVTSSVIRRNKGLTLLDDRFEKVFEQYDDEEIGALDHEDIDGRLDPNSKVLTSLVNEFEQQQSRPKLKDVIEKVENLAVDSDEAEEGGDIVEMVEVEEPKEKWDCESILSTYSTLYNHPTLIKEPKKVRPIQISERTGIPLHVLPERGLTLKQIEKEMNARNREDRACTYRPDDETAEERKARKGAVKDERKMRRQEKKATKLAFRKEHLLHSKQLINAARTEGVKMT